MSNDKQNETSVRGAEEGVRMGIAPTTRGVALQRGYRPWKAVHFESDRERSLELGTETLDVAEQFPVQGTHARADMYLWVIEAGVVTAKELDVKTDSLAVRA